MKLIFISLPGNVIIIQMYKKIISSGFKNEMKVFIPIRKSPGGNILPTHPSPKDYQMGDPLYIIQIAALA